MSTRAHVKIKTKKKSTLKKPPNIFRALIRFSLELKGLTIKKLAEQYGVTEGSIGQAYSRPCPTAERRIAEAIGKKPQDLWPDRYDENGKPNRRNAWYDRGRRSSSKRITQDPSVNGKDRLEINHEKNDQSEPNVSF